ncbi:hypothetical protein [Candidatus Stoquefichus massiliensis]|uniref:hypothetical protein n=1 Tax=Candidatus Stoquefichus massiliensis TaxID=1470350 RepID=UPI000489ECF1|nr:hypothetical protein [Candidatus Stoquefichus massiliensis]
MHSHKAIKNVVISLIYQFINLLFGFFVPRALIFTYGSDVNGLTSTMTQILNLVSLLQTGMVGASIFEMYKPIINNDLEIEASIYNSSKKYFKKMSLWFLLVLSLMIPYLLLTNSSKITSYEIIVSVLFLTCNSYINFRFYTCFDIVFSAHEDKYLIIYSQVIERVTYYFFIILSISLKLNFIFIYFGMLSGGVLKTIYCHIHFNKTYKDRYRKIIPKEYKIKNQYYLFCNQIVQQVLESIPIILITGIYDLSHSSIYSIYLMIMNVIKLCINTILNALSASFGQKTVELDIDGISEVYDFLNFIIFLITVVSLPLFSALINGFIQIYTSGLNHINYINTTISLLCIFYLISYVFYSISDFVVVNLGLFKKTFKSTVFVGSISVLITFIFTIIDFSCTFIGLIVFYIILSVLRFRITSYKLNYKYRLILGRAVLIIVMSLIFYRISYLILINSLKMFICVGMVSLILILLCTMIYCVLFEKRNLKLVIFFLKNNFYRRN